MPYDYIVVGSGVSGMTAAVILAQAERKVLVLEQAAAPGGLMRSYVRSGLRFPIGVHSVGAAGEGQILAHYLKRLGVLDRVRLLPMNPDGFEEYCFPDFRFRVPVGVEAFRTRLEHYFPNEKNAVSGFLKDLNSVVNRFPYYAPHQETSAGILPTRLFQPLRDYLDALTKCRELKAVLAACNPRYGLPPSRCPTYVHFLVLDSYLRGSWRVNENHCPLSRAFTLALRERDGQLRCNARVAALECLDRQVRGVRLADGEMIPAKAVIFTGNPKQLPALCGNRLRPTYRAHLEETPETPGAFVAAVRWAGERCPMTDMDAYFYDTWDLEAPYGRTRIMDGETPHLLYCSATEAGQPDVYSLTTFCLLSMAETATWSAGRVGARPSGYEAAKRRVAERMIAQVREARPTTATLQAVDAFTPLTIRDYTLSPAGSCYGLSPTRLTVAARIGGLHLAGQSAYVSGIVGALIGAVETCENVLGRASLKPVAYPISAWPCVPSSIKLAGEGQ